MMVNNPLINILTRTSNRPKFFKDCAASVRLQDYKNIRHIVGADNQETFDYAKKETSDVFLIPSMPRKPQYGIMHSPYNLYMNALTAEVKEGWVICLDDDDMLTRPDAISTLVKNLTAVDSLVLWKVQFPHRVIPSPQTWGRFPVLGDIASIGFAYHISHNWAAQWDEVKESDFRVILKLFRVLPQTVWLDDILTKVNYTQIENLVGAGSGLQKDK